MNILEELMNERWIVKAKDKDKYYYIKDNIGELKKFLAEKLGYHIFVTPAMIKLEKIPGKAENWMGVEDFTDPIEYGFLCIILMFLEDKEAEEQFVLSQLTEYISSKYQDAEIDWTKYHTRRQLIHVIKFCLKNSLFTIDDGTEEEFSSNYEAEALYANTGLSRYFMRNFTTDIMGYSKPKDFENSEWMDMNQDRGFARRHRVYRRILMSMGVYSEGTEDEDFVYIKHYRNMIENDLEQYLDCNLQVHKTSAYLVIGKDGELGRTFPENNTLSDIILLFHNMIRQKVTQGILNASVDENMDMSLAGFEQLINEFRQKYRSGFIKTYRDKTSGEFTELLKKYMIFMEMIQIDLIHNQVTIRPIVGKITGQYPEDYKMEESNDAE
ncbi:MAG: hypothetical protein K0R21_109 [Anaerocolumna sp.]|jgi:uncharacterized protein (TIGR02678 family)|nr:hypothetical protein [Anaerocolumna sp.]